MAKKNYEKKIRLKDEMIDYLCDRRTYFARKNGNDVDYTRERRREREQELEGEREREREHEREQELQREQERERDQHQERRRRPAPEQPTVPGSETQDNARSEMLVIRESTLFIISISIVQAFSKQRIYHLLLQ